MTRPRTSPPIGNWHGLLLAGGMGIRAKPLTLAVPKALLPFRRHTLIELLMDRMRFAGVTRFTIAVKHMAMHVEGYLRRARPELNLHFQRERKRLGTAGSLQLLGSTADHFLVCNADILTDLDFPALQRTHLASQADITIMAVEHRYSIAYGCLDFAPTGQLRSWREKPVERALISGGVYAVSATATRLIRPNESIDMPDLIRRALQRSRTVVGYRHEGQWHDIGTVAAYKEALDSFRI